VARRRFDTVRNFSLFAHAEDPATKFRLPASSAGASGHARPRPSSNRTGAGDHDLRHWTFHPKARSAHTYHYLFGLLAATGLRISEASRLQCNDLVEDGLIVRNGKFGKQRLITLQPSTASARSLSRHPSKAWRHGQ
jgi:integrase